MISFSTIPAPDCLREFAAAEPPPPFDAPAFQHCKTLVRGQLLANQQHQCAYCESPIEDHGDVCHLDHVESQKDNEGRRFDITNLVAACQNKDTCGHAHGSLSVPDGLNPYRTSRLHLAFECSGGELFALDLEASIEKFAFENLMLNDPGLKTARNNLMTRLMQQTIALGTNARRRLQNLSTDGVGFRSLHYQVLGKFGFPEP